MERIIFIVLFFILFSLSFAQKNDAVIKTESNSIKIELSDLYFNFSESRSGNITIRDYYDFTDESSSGTYKLPSKDIIIAIPPNSAPKIKVNSLEPNVIKFCVPSLNPRYVINSDSTASYIIPEYSKSTKNYKNNLYIVKGCLWIRDLFCLHLQLNPVEFDDKNSSLIENKKIIVELEFDKSISINSYSPLKYNSQFEKIVYSSIINPEISEQFRSDKFFLSNDSTGNWIDYNSTYLKIGVAEDFIYRLNKTKLEQAGILTNSINPKNFKLFYEGEEIPIFVQGENDGSFDNSDYIEFWGQKNYNKISARTINQGYEPYNNYLNPYTDTSYYFLTWNNGFGKRIYLDSIFTNSVNDTLNYYTDFKHIEQDNGYLGMSVEVVENQDPELSNLKFWYFKGYGIGTVYQSNFYCPDLVINKPANLLIKFVSYASGRVSNSHNISLKINNTLVDTFVLDRNKIALIGKPFNSNLINQTTNSFIFTNHQNGVSPNNLIMDWYEIEYPRKLSAINDSIIFQIRDTSLTKALRIIKIDNITSNDFILYKTSSLKKITGFQKVGSTILFTDTVGYGDSYILIKPSYILTPQQISKKQFVNLRDFSRSAGYIAITNKNFRTAAQNYNQFISSKYSTITSLIFTEDIFDEFSYGNPDPASIRAFLKTAYTNWTTPKPEYVCLMGSATYDYKEVKFRINGWKHNSNLVPSYGEPVSDTWFTMWDTTQSYIQQMLIGRIPVRNENELNYYLQKHQNYLTQRYDLWNKSSMFFSGGLSSDSSQISLFKGVNDFIVDNYVKLPPFVLNFNHFYKTVYPISDFGPYEPLYIFNTISNGGIFISYIGHSGTRTWDNSITDPNQLNNKFNKASLNTDFGCSTNKFAEPDIESFGQLFIDRGQAIGYIGNTSLGFISTGTTVPKYFYESLLNDTILNIGQLHLSSKLKLFSRNGYSSVNRIFALTNLLAGDPIVNLALPTKPNLSINNSGINLLDSETNDQLDSVRIKINFFNYGTTAQDSIQILIKDNYLNSVSFSNSVTFKIPDYEKSFVVNIPVKNKAGEHNIEVLLDSDNKINELYKDDNSASLKFTVASTSVNPLITNELFSVANKSLVVLNPFVKSLTPQSQLIYQVDLSNNFLSPSTYSINLDTFYTKINLSNLTTSNRYWLRLRTNSSDTSWGQSFTLKRINTDYNFIADDNFAFSKFSFSGVTYSNSITLNVDTVKLEVISSGGNFNKYGAIKKNGINVLPATFNWGMGVAVFDMLTFNLDTTNTFWYGDDSKMADSLASLLNAAPNGKLICLTVMDDGRSMTSKLKTAIKSLGSKYIDTLKYRAPWLLISKKGNPSTVLIEKVESPNFQDFLTADTTFYVNLPSGTFVTPEISHSSKWKNVFLNSNLPVGSNIQIKPLGIKKSGVIDTLSNLTFSNNSADISSIDTKIYPSIKLYGKLMANSLGESPAINSLSIDYNGLPELGTNYQTVTTFSDTITAGKNIDYKFFVVNAGEISADSVEVKVSCLSPDNSSQLLYHTNTNIPPLSKKEFIARFNLGAGSEQRTLLISIDPNNIIPEYFENNNNYSIPILLKADTTKANVKITFDGLDIIDGDFVSSNPKIKIELNDYSLLSITDTSFLRVYLNEKRIFLSDSNFVFNLNNPKVVVNYSPVLADGEYTLKIMARDANGYLIDSSGIYKYFTVQKDAKLFYVYNYPNPFSNETYFTFKLTQIPDELKIKIFTVAGRLVKEITKHASELNFDFNRIYWNGSDEDGDLLSNGIYFYKIILKKDGKTITETQKIAILR